MHSIFKFMVFKLFREDGDIDQITEEVFISFDSAYDRLEEIYGDICCSDADYEDRPYYEIKEIIE